MTMESSFGSCAHFIVTAKRCGTLSQLDTVSFSLCITLAMMSRSMGGAATAGRSATPSRRYTSAVPVGSGKKMVPMSPSWSGRSLVHICGAYVTTYSALSRGRTTRESAPVQTLLSMDGRRFHTSPVSFLTTTLFVIVSRTRQLKVTTSVVVGFSMHVALAICSARLGASEKRSSIWSRRPSRPTSVGWYVSSHICSVCAAIMPAAGVMVKSGARRFSCQWKSRPRSPVFMMVTRFVTRVPTTTGPKDTCLLSRWTSAPWHEPLMVVKGSSCPATRIFISAWNGRMRCCGRNVKLIDLVSLGFR
mmetsp:Transcript_33852/g.104516  ORF Transcript_33852/g.104516 Transcript_33852/m.104516 type:complete len:304 (+) Transcript_33852:1407-2318(+)